jgi:cytoskeletal protein CcmA (bactofilin family)
MEELHNLTVNGSGSYSGGKYRKIIIRGESTITDDTESASCKIYGTSQFLKNLETRSISVFGEVEVRGDLNSEETNVFGTMEIDGAARLKQAKVRGSLKIKEKMSGEMLDIKGNITVENDVEVEEFHSSGSFKIIGLLNAGTISINLRYAESEAKEIGGETITVRRKSSLIPFLQQTGTLVSHLIEGDTIYLENTRAEIVRGKDVTIGPGCEIGKVEYSEDYKKLGDAQVNKEFKI